MTMKSNGIDFNAMRTIHDCEERVESLKSELGLREQSYPYHREVPGTKSQNFFGRTSKNESYSMTGSNESLGHVSKVGAFDTEVNMRTNELFTLPHTGTDLPRAFSCGEKNNGKQAASDKRCSKEIEIVDNSKLDHSTCKYLEKEDLLAENIQEFNKSCIYLKSKTEHVQTGNSSLRTCDPSVQISNCSLQTSNPKLHPGNSSLQTVILDSIGGHSKLQTGNNWTLSGPCKHNLLPSSKKLGSDDGLSCRICHSVTDLETLVSPCLCTGSMKYVHESCLLNWLKSSVKTNCELCLHEVPVKKLVKPWREWRFLDEKPIPIIWLLSFLILFTLNILSVIKDASRGCTSTTCIVFYVLGCSGAVLGIIFLWFWAKKSAVYFKKLLILNQDWLLDENYCKTNNKGRTLNYNV